MLQGELSAILMTFIKLPFVIKIFVLSIFEWPPKTGFTVVNNSLSTQCVLKRVCALIGSNVVFFFLNCFSNMCFCFSLLYIYSSK